MRRNIRLPGGLSEGHLLSEYDPRKIEQGRLVEREHTSDDEAAQWIAADHLTEDADYYDKLAIMEARENARPGSPARQATPEWLVVRVCGYADTRRETKWAVDSGDTIFRFLEPQQLGLKRRAPGMAAQTHVAMRHGFPSNGWAWTVFGVYSAWPTEREARKEKERLNKILSRTRFQGVDVLPVSVFEEHNDTSVLQVRPNGRAPWSEVFWEGYYVGFDVVLQHHTMSGDPNASVPPSPYPAGSVEEEDWRRGVQQGALEAGGEIRFEMQRENARPGLPAQSPWSPPQEWLVVRWLTDSKEAPKGSSRFARVLKGEMRKVDFIVDSSWGSEARAEQRRKQMSGAVEVMTKDDLKALLRPSREKGYRPNGRDYWGKQAAGAVIYCPATHRILLGLRSQHVMEPGTWAGFGGKVEQGEDIEEAMLREVYEETELHPADVTGVQLVWTFKDKSFSYFNYLITVAEEFEPMLSWETDEAGWFDLEDLPQPLHFGFQAFYPHLRMAL